MVDKSFLIEPVLDENQAKDRFPPDAVTDADTIDDLFTRAFRNFPESEFLESVYEWWEQKGFITEKQYVAVSKIADR